LQVRDLRFRMEREMEVREERRNFRHRRGGEGGRTWWESEDLPRIEELNTQLGHVAVMERELAHLLLSPFLPPAAPLRGIPESTPLVRNHKAYSSAYRVVLSHFRAFRVQMDDKHLLTRARSLPVLYEWWCLLEVLRVLRSCLDFAETEQLGGESPF